MNQYAVLINPERTRWYAKLIRKRGSNRLYIYLVYFDEIICRTTGMIDTEVNRIALGPLIDKINRQIASGEFRFAEAFPGASDVEKRRYSELEGITYRPKPSCITVGDVFKIWQEKAYPNLPTESMRRDALNPLVSRVVPYFAQYPLDKVTPQAIEKFFFSLKNPTPETHMLYSSNRVKREPLTAKRMRIILGAFNRLWSFGCKEFAWDLKSPFGAINSYITSLTTKKEYQIRLEGLDDRELTQLLSAAEKNETSKVKVLRFSEFKKILSFLPAQMVPAAELMYLTGMIASEVGALPNSPAPDDFLVPRLSLSRGKIQTFLKTPFRMRKIPVTNSLRRVLDNARSQAQGPLLFKGIRGGFFNEKIFRDAWYKACDAAGVPRIKPYGLRHSFVVNCEVLGIPKIRIISLMGHADKSMIDRVYGKYREGIENEREEILAYYGEDFITGEWQRTNSSKGKF